MRENVAPEVKVKAAGGIRTPEQFLAFVDAGVDRIGCSASVEIFEALSKQL
jgi:deoxyribose-phosphate aldolase